VELTNLLRLARKWAWFFILAALLSGGSIYLYTKSLPVRYRSQAIISVGGYLEATNPNFREIRTGYDLVQSYQALATTRRILQGVIDAGYPLTIEELEEAVSSRVVGGTSMIVLTVTHTNRDIVQGIADELVNQLILNSPSTLNPEEQEQFDQANAEIQRMQRLQDQLETRLNEINAQLDTITMGTVETTPEELTQLAGTRNLLIDQLNQNTLAIATLANTISEMRARTNTLQIIDTASPPSTIRADVLNATIIGVMAGLALAFGVVGAVEYLDNTIKNAEDVIRVTGLEVIGKITIFNPRRLWRRQSPMDMLIVEKEPQSGAAEAYRAMRTRLLYKMEAAPGARTYLITSATPAEGKSVTAANLAVSMAMANLNVLLIDADLRRPKLHEFFGLPNDFGLTSLLETDPVDVLDNPVDPDLGIEAPASLQNTHIPGLRLITTGPPPSNPAELLGSYAMHRWFNVFEQAVDVDVIIFDTPPINRAADCMVLATLTEGGVVMVMRAGKTRPDPAYQAAMQLRQINLKVLGVVLNAVKSKAEPVTTGSPVASVRPAPSVEAETLPWRGALPGLSEALGRQSGRHKPAVILPADTSVDRPRAAADSEARLSRLKRNTLLLYIEDYEEPIAVNVRRRITLGRYTTGLGASEHIDLEPYGAFEAGVSRVHVAIERRRGQFYLEDLNSVNGTWLDGDQVEAGQQIPLRSGQLIQLGNLRLRVYCLTPAERPDETLETPAEELEGDED